MPDINTSTGLSYVLPNEIQPRDNMSATDALFDTSKNVWRGFLDENIIALSALYATKYIFNENPTYELDDNYNIFNDPQLRQHGLEKEAKECEQQAYENDNFRSTRNRKNNNVVKSSGSIHPRGNKT